MPLSEQESRYAPGIFNIEYCTLDNIFIVLVTYICALYSIRFGKLRSKLTLYLAVPVQYSIIRSPQPGLPDSCKSHDN